MIISEAAPERALVLVANASQRDQACARLSRDGYEVLGFADCENAAAWLDEETPTIALIDEGFVPSCSDILDILSERDVPLI